MKPPDSGTDESLPRVGAPKRQLRFSDFTVRRCLSLPALAFLWALAIPRETVRAQSPMTCTPFEAVRHLPSDTWWASLVRLREQETPCLSSAQWRSAYLQVRAMAEASITNHRAALRFADEITGSLDSSHTFAIPKGTRAADAVTMITAAADTARVVMINERHHAGGDRLLTLQLLPLLRARGYRYFAAEALSPQDTALMTRGYALEATTGFYTGEPVFAEVIREALRLGYTIVPYELTDAQQRPEKRSLSAQEYRDRTEALNLIEQTIRRDPSAKVLVHAGYGHVEEGVIRDWHPMAAYFKELTGIDPVTVEQTWLSERSDSARESFAYRAADRSGLLGRRAIVLIDSGGRRIAPIDRAVDFQLFSPRTNYINQRPAWLGMDGRRLSVAVGVPECAQTTCAIDAHNASEPDSATALDRSVLENSRVAHLYLPPLVEIRIRISTLSGQLMRSCIIRIDKLGQRVPTMSANSTCAP
jgi:hypothetical protein